MTQFKAIYNGKSIIVESDKGIWDAKLQAIEQLKVPKSKQGMLSIMSLESIKNQDFRFL